ncbi:dihydroorotase (plasmid) [Haloferax prahovense]|uniref:dihydroorotase n=1 Tax=Haloferax prahovense TaxID=381852 RepID=UPI003C707825
MRVDTLIKGGTIVSPERTIEGTVAINDGKIVGIGDKDSAPDAAEVVDASEKLILPGVVDPHVHIDGQNSRDSYSTGTKAGAIGGVTSCINFAWQGWNDDADTWDDEGTLQEAVDRQIEKGADSVIDFGLHGTITREDSGVLDELQPLVDRGVTSFKMFTAYEFGLTNGFINRVLQEIKNTDAVALFHTEDESVCAELTAELKATEKGDARHYPSSRPDYAEAMAAESAVRMAREAGTKYYGVHTTCEAAARVLDRYQEDGSKVRAETCTHYVALDESAYESAGTLPVIAPPLRTNRDREVLFRHLRNNSLSVVSTDHVATKRAKKDVPNWWETSFGANSLQHSLPVLHDEAVNKRGFSYPFLVRVMCSNPAATFGLPQKGTLDPGTDADIVIFDPNEEYTIDAAQNASIADYSIYDGRTVTGKVSRTYLRGELIASGGDVTVEPGFGEFIERDVPDWDV